MKRMIAVIGILSLLFGIGCKRTDTASSNPSEQTQKPVVLNPVDELKKIADKAVGRTWSKSDSGYRLVWKITGADYDVRQTTSVVKRKRSVNSVVDSG